VGGLVDELDGETLDLVIGNARGVLAQLVPELGGELSSGSTVSADQLCQLVVGVLQRLARRGPLVLIFEDVHWADTTTLALLSLLTRLGRLGPVLVVASFRSDELHRRHPLRPVVAEIERDERCTRIDVRPLDASATAELIGALDVPLADQEFAGDVYRRSAGNAFFIEELVAAHESRLDGVPEALRDVILARAAPLDDAATALLSAVAAAGGTTPEVLTAVCGFDGDQLRATLEVLFDTALLAPAGDEVRFRHELAREVFDEAIVPGERARLHGRLADALAQFRPARLGEIARHWDAAHDSARTLAASLAAGRQALRAGAAAEAEAHLGRALELWDTVDDAARSTGIDHPALCIETAVAAEHARHLDRAIDLHRRAVAELVDIDPMREADVWLELRDLYRFTHRWDDCERAVARALVLIPSSPPTSARAEALAHAALAEYYAKRPESAMERAREAVDIADAVGDPEVRVCAHNALGAAMSISAHDPEERLAHARAVIEMCGPRVSTERALTAFNGLMIQLSTSGRYPEAAAIAERGVTLARTTGLGGIRAAWLASGWIQMLTELGRWDDVEERVHDLGDLLDHPQEREDIALSWGAVLIRQGRLEEARPLIDAARALFSPGRWEPERPGLSPVVAMFDAAERRYEQVGAMVDDRLAVSPGDHDDLHLVAVGVGALADYAEAARAVHDDDGIRCAEATARRWTVRVRSQRHDVREWADAPLLRDLGLAELARLRGHREPERWAQLAAGWAAFGVRYDEAYARFRHAEALLAGTPGRASAVRQAASVALAAAYSIAVELRAAPLLTDVDGLARRARLSVVDQVAIVSPPARDVPEDDFDLTPRERDVLALLERGRSNSQIGAELYISAKTASVHVSNILRKLGVANRFEAAARAERARAR
jgi:DNA-binding CsgD family transcriptional regulator/tetratricopeptide (TPR) repeat protein